DVNILDPQFTMGTILDELQADPAILPSLTAAPGWQAFCFNPKFIVKTPLSDFDRPFNHRGFRHAVSHIIPREDIINILLAGLGTEIFSPIPITSWAAIPPDEFLLWKRTYEAPGGHKLEWDATTPFDDYNITRALEYMSSEGYDMRPFGGPGPNVVWPGSEPTTSIIPTTSIPTAHTTIPSTTTSSVLPTTSETTTTQISTTSTLSIPTITPSLEALILILAITLMIAFFRRRK
ncbi:MAG: ABC transporter substrate-binding protein, partial [Candidatus Hodarchaeota archaeon]